MNNGATERKIEMEELRKISSEELKKILGKHQKWLNYEEGGERADLSGADLNGADLDFSCLPLWCGSLNAYFDDRQIIQILYHAIKAGTQSRNVSEELKYELYKLADVANSFHRIEECGRIEVPKGE